MADTTLLIIDMQSGNFSESNPVHKGMKLLAKTKNIITHKSPLIACSNCLYSKQRCKRRSRRIWLWWMEDTSFNCANERRHSGPEEDTRCILWNQPVRKAEIDGHKKVVVIGLQTEYCVDTTCRRAFSLGYNVTLVKDSKLVYNSKSTVFVSNKDKTVLKNPSDVIVSNNGKTVIIKKGNSLIAETRRLASLTVFRSARHFNHQTYNSEPAHRMPSGANASCRKNKMWCSTWTRKLLPNLVSLASTCQKPAKTI